MSDLIIRMDAVKCNECGRIFSVREAGLRGYAEGELHVRFFACPHCGKLYNAGTTDGVQRELLKKRGMLARQLQRAKTEDAAARLSKLWRETGEKMEARRTELTERGDRLLSVRRGRI